MLKSEQYEIFSRFFRALRTDQKEFQNKCMEGLYKLEQLHKSSLNRIEQILKGKFQSFRNQLQRMYDLSQKINTESSSQEQLFYSQEFPKIYGPIISWFKSNKQVNISQYAQNLSKQVFHKYQEEFNKINRALKGDEDCCDSSGSEDKQKKIDLRQRWSKHQPGLRGDNGSKEGILVRQILDLPKDMIEKVMQEVKKGSLKQEYLNAEARRRKKKRNADLIKEVGISFSGAKHDTHFKYLPKPLKQKLGNNKQYQFILKTTLSTTAKNIESLVQRQFGFRRMTHNQRLSINTDLKNYHLWMQKDQSEIFIKAYILFNELDKNVEISSYQNFVLYVLMTNKYLQNLKYKAARSGTKPVITQNQSPKNIRKQITYLYYHYDNLNKVKTLLQDKYFLDNSITSQFLDQQFKSIIVETYHRICRQHYLENRRYQRILMEIKDYSNQPWSLIATQYIEYQIHNKLSDKGKDCLRKTMDLIVSQCEPKQNGFGNDVKLLKSKNEMLSGQSQNWQKKSIIMNFKMENRQRREEVIHNTKVIKLEEDSSSEAQSVDS